MTLYVVIAWDGPDSVPLREAALDAHFAHIETIVDKIAVAGPLKDDAGITIGSLFVLKVRTQDEADAILRSDPYFKAGVWERWTIHPFLAAAGDWVGGKIW
jgi:uncharacterized protein